jgi:AsmA family/AsmA-like C-terminal region
MKAMTENQQARQSRRMKVWLPLSALAVILVLLIAPPFISIRRYQSRITQVIAASVGRPVRLSSVELRVLPRPSFVITDLTVQEDLAYGAEPVLHANTVTASIRLMPLWWRARLEISRISVDEASLNLVRTADGRWNIDAFFRSAATRAQSVAAGGRPMPFPYLEATDSRVNIKRGVEKLPYSLVNADLSFWEDSPGEWQVRLKGQPARTDVSLDLPDTGILRMEGRMRRAPELRRMPIHLDVDWRQAQLGQLSRLLMGDDQGWRGNLTGEIHVDGTADAAQITTRLRASGVHRAEFAPAAPIDFDATCSLLYHHSDRALEKLLCDSPIGEGRARLTRELPAKASEPRLVFELDRVPAQLALDTLRTVRSGIDPSLQAAGSMSGRISYAPETESPDQTAAPLGKPSRNSRIHGPPPGPLSGTINIAALRLTSDSLSRAIILQKLTVEPAPGRPAALTATVPLPAGANSPLTLTVRLAMNGYEVGVRGNASFPRLRELAKVAGIRDSLALQQLEGPVALDLSTGGPWLRAPAAPRHDEDGPNVSSAPVLVGASDHISGTLTLHASSWRPAFLPNPIEITNAVLHIEEPRLLWDPAVFSYGPVHGSATLSVPANCLASETCSTSFAVHFGSVDLAALQAAILGTQKPGTLVGSLMARLRPDSNPNWPSVEGIVRADTVMLGPVTLTDAQVDLRIQPEETNLTSLSAGLLGGRISAAGSLVPRDKPEYRLKGHFDQLSAAEIGQLLGMNWSGNPIDGNGEVALAGFTNSELAASAKGAIHFDWKHGSVAGPGASEIPPILEKFDRWTADAEIADGAISLKQNQVQRGTRRLSAQGTAIFGNPPQVTLGPRPDDQAADRHAKP